MVLYIILVLLLIGCLAFLVYRTRQQKQAYQDRVQQMKSQETEYIQDKKENETETETEQTTETEVKKTSATSAKKQTEKAAAAATPESDEEETQGETTVTLDVSGYLAHRWYFRAFPPKKTAVIYDVREGMEKLIGQYGLENKFDVKETLQVEECLQNLQKLDELEVVFLSGIHSHDRNIILKYCIRNGIQVYVIPRVGDVLMSGAKQVHMFHLPMLRTGTYNPQPEYLFIKRLIDILLSGVASILFSPVMIVTAIAIKAYDGGPVFYSQTRLTKGGREFGVLKFRSMKVNAEKDGVARLSSGEHDPRITPVGHVIRKCRIDELPQLLNILKGDMSIVGPRPERPQIAEEYEKAMPEFYLRLQVKAGLTGYAQVYGKYNTTPYDKLLMDLMYISHANILDDLFIMFATVKILFMPESTEGVAEGQTTALQETAAADEEKESK